MRRREFIKSAIGGALLYGSPGLRALQSGHNEPVPDPAVKRVLVMFKCHFDAGFIDTQKAVVQRYFTVYFPRAMELAAQLRQSSELRYVWTTGSWLLYEYLEQASTGERARIEKAISSGDLAWHALPFTWQTELLDASMIAGAIGLSQTLDKRFGRKTTGAKMTDVPGHTRGLIAPLTAQGVKFLDIGVNDASTPAEVPPLFLWKNKSGASLVVMYHHGYGGVVRIPNSDHAIAIVVRDDNSGPHTVEEIRETYKNLGERFPNASIVPTNLSDIAEAVDPHRDSLPTVNGEIGDTWIHGVASDPLKLARYRELARLRQRWLAQGEFGVGDATDLVLLRRLLLEVEHTWGTDTKTWLDFDHYTPADLAAVIDTKNYKVVRYSWQEKRDDLLAGIAALPPRLREQAEAAVKGLDAVPPRVGTPKRSSEIETAHYILKFDEKTGAIHRLLNKKSNREWASKKNPLALFSYQTLSQQDYSLFFERYVVSDEDWAKKDFGKPNIERYGAQSQEWFPVVSDLTDEEDERGHRVLLSLRIDDSQAQRSGRAAFPANIYLEAVLPKAEPVIHFKLSWFEKPSTRLPEALWLSFHPICSNPKSWILEKSGEQVSPLEVVASGNRHMHAVTGGIRYSDERGDFHLDTLDAPVITLGTKSPLPFSKQQPDLLGGIHCSLFNNAWGTNYIMWFGEDMSFRFILRA